LDGLGDFILWLDSAQHYKKIYPNKKITLIINSEHSELAKKIKYWDQIFLLDKVKFTRNIIYRIITLLKLRHLNLDICIHPNFSRFYEYGDTIVRSSNATQRIGFIGNLDNISYKRKSESDLWYTNLIDYKHSDFNHELKKNAEFVSALAGIKISAALQDLRFICDKKKYFPEEYIVIFPGSSWSGKQWPTDKYIEVIKWIINKYNYKMVLCGSKSDKEICTRIKKSLGDSVENLCEKTSIVDLINIINNSKLLVTNDTSAIHIAAGLGTKAISIVGGGHFGRFLPYPKLQGAENIHVAYNMMDCFGCNWQCTKKYDVNSCVPCIDTVQVSLVKDQINKILKI
jgi:ADP-heptose:LPS heptosyltransferase